MAGTESPPAIEPAIRMIAMPADANPSGDIFGGWIMSLMDMAGGNIAYQRAGGRVATVAVDDIEFHQPVAVGDEVSVYAQVTRAGRTSLDTDIEVWVRGRVGGVATKVTEGRFTFVHIDSDRRPIPLPAA